jgi:hypothetical protein
VNVAAKDFYSKRFLNVLTKGRIQRPLSSPPSPPSLSSPPSPPSGSPIAHSTLLLPAPFRRFRPPTFDIFGRDRMAAPRRWFSAQKPQPVSRKKEEEDLSAQNPQPVTQEEGNTIPLQNMEREASGEFSVEAEPLDNASSVLSHIKEEE